MKACVHAMGRVLALAGLLCVVARSGPVTGTKQSTRLYTPPDSSAPGGIMFQVPERVAPVRAAVAVPALSREKAYAGQISDDGRRVVFHGLPTDRYDLLLVFDRWFAEGFLLHRDPSTLTPDDQNGIRETIERSVPFFDTKVIHRCEGVGGQAGRAAAVLQEVRTRPVTLQDASVRTDIQVRSLKLAFLEEVGPGWHLVRTRELLRQEVGPNDAKGVLRHVFVPALQGIRVLDSVRDLGVVDLPAPP